MFSVRDNSSIKVAAKAETQQQASALTSHIVVCDVVLEVSGRAQERLRCEEQEQVAAWCAVLVQALSTICTLGTQQN
jgi:hypothetical protein